MMRIYEYEPEEVDEVLTFRNAIFNYISREHWEAMNCTAVVAREGDRLVGFIPVQFREQCLDARVTIPVVYENAVGVAEGMRGRGIGTQMIEEVARFISDRVDAMMVIRGGERSDGYRFYRKTGHSDLMYARSYSLAPERRPLSKKGACWSSREITILDRERWLALEPRLLTLYGQRYGRFGGGQRREPGYWSMILNSHVYREGEWRLITLWSKADGLRPGDEVRPLDGGHPAGHLVGYLVAADGLWAPSEDIYIYEVAGEDDDAVEQLIWYMSELGRGGCGEPTWCDSSGGRIVVPYVSLANPVRSTLHRMGYTEEPSTPHVMARILRPDRIFERLAAGSDLLHGLCLTVVTPHRTLVVNDPPGSKYTVQLETKESMLARLFCRRLDLAAALDMELIRWNGRDPGLRRELSTVFESAEWVQWFTDFV